MIWLLACTTATENTEDTEFGSDPRVEDTADLPLATLLVSEGTVVDDDEDGFWAPGEDADVLVTLTNAGSESFPYYPGVVLTVDDADIELHNDDWYLYDLAAGASTTAVFEATAGGTMASETTVTFTASAHVLGCEEDECPDPGEHIFPVLVEEPPVDTASPD
ncbi:MAG: hypothetical protein GY884_09460 [Proteobacteria bacterium]|nr:hypothetical protein [Pseudomonadota bacterium]